MSVRYTRRLFQTLRQIITARKTPIPPLSAYHCWKESIQKVLLAFHARGQGWLRNASRLSKLSQREICEASKDEAPRPADHRRSLAFHSYRTVRRTEEAVALDICSGPACRSRAHRKEPRPQCCIQAASASAQKRPDAARSGRVNSASASQLRRNYGSPCWFYSRDINGRPSWALDEAHFSGCSAFRCRSSFCWLFSGTIRRHATSRLRPRLRSSQFVSGQWRIEADAFARRLSVTPSTAGFGSIRRHDVRCLCSSSSPGLRYISVPFQAGLLSD